MSWWVVLLIVLGSIALGGIVVYFVLGWYLSKGLRG